MIVFCHLLNDNSGSPVVLKSTIRALSSTSDSCLLLIGSQGRGCLESSGISISRYWYRRSRFRIVTLCTFFLSQISLYMRLSRSNIPRNSVIYVNTLLPFAAALWGRRHGHTVIYHVHEVSITPGILRRFLVSFVKRYAHRVFYVSEDQRRRLPIHPVKSVVIPNPIPVEVLEASNRNVYAPHRSGYFEVLMLASPRDFKGVPEFFETARRFLTNESVRFTLVLNASGQEIRNYLHHYDQPSNITIHPRTESPSNFYNTADVLVNLSRVDQWIETFGMTVIEAMAFGLPVIVPPVGGPSEIVTHEVEGYLVDSRELDQVEGYLRNLMLDSSLALRMSKNAKSRSLDFSQRNFFKKLKQQLVEVNKHLDESNSP